MVGEARLPSNAYFRVIALISVNIVLSLDSKGREQRMYVTVAVFTLGCDRKTSPQIYI